MLRSAFNLAIAAVSAVLLLAGSSLSFADEPGGFTRVQAPRCGGIAGLTCPRGLVCRMDGDRYPDQMGVCVEPARGCTREYRPVCGFNGQTYANRCLAEREGVRIRHQGACRGRPNGDEGSRCGGIAGRTCDRGLYCYMTEEQADREDGTGVCRSRPEVCTREYRPVCGTDGRTYGNACSAASAGVNVDYQGQCRERPRPRPPQACTREYRPVCGVNGQTYPNECEADRAGVRVDHQGACRERPRPPRPEVCPNIYQPVCGEDGATYPSACEAARAGADVRHEGQCRRR